MDVLLHSVCLQAKNRACQRTSAAEPLVLFAWLFSSQSLHGYPLVLTRAAPLLLRALNPSGLRVYCAPMCTEHMQASP